jgi:FlaA1/EpsC-like NDP-sugar epimerase
MNHATKNKRQQTKRSARKQSKWHHWRKIATLLTAYDIFVVAFSYFFALWLRFDLQFDNIPHGYLSAWEIFLPVYVLFCFCVFRWLRLYKSIWRFASYSELRRILLSSIITSIFHGVAMNLFVCRMPVSYYLFGAVLQFLFVTGIRFSYRFVLLLRSSARPVSRQRGEAPRQRVMLIGAGNAGQMILRDIKRSPGTHDRVCCLIDDNPNKWWRDIDGVMVVGGRDAILPAVKRYRIDKIYIAIPSATRQEKRALLDICSASGCELKQLPGMYQLVNGQVSVSNLKQVSIEDLLGRDPIRVDLAPVFRALAGKVVMVTGGGGSIGSELCRQIAAHHPRQLIIFDIYENNAYAIQLELRDKYPDLDLVTLIGSVRDSRRVQAVFKTYRPQIVYHAAAHKHVPLMEDSPCEAVKNNAFGTYKTAMAAAMHGCERFVLISTDKAVNPTNIMGATKRLCEMIIQSFDAKIKAGQAKTMPPLFAHEARDNAAPKGAARTGKTFNTEFVAVRFGNVLGSNGSVIPIFKKQIEKGGPVTVTHPDIIRYFMTIPEAVSLVLLAGTYARGGEIFVLDMGEPVKIDTLARNMIRLSGFKPDEDIKIEYTGLRPGEKLFEEKLMAEEGIRKTKNALIHIGKPIPFDTDVFLGQLAELMQEAYANQKNIRERVAAMVPTYRFQGKSA